MGHRQSGLPGSGPAVVQGRLRPPRVRAIRRERLDRRLRLWSHRLTVVCAPAGAGKTTLAVQAAQQSDGPVCWYRASGEDSAPATFLAYLHRALHERPELAGVTGPTPWRTLQEACAALESWRGARALLVVDDLQTLFGTPAEATIERLLEDGPAWLHVLAATQRLPRWNLSRLRVSGELCELGAEDLRFRAAEVAELFAGCWGRPLAAEHAGWLAHETEGWAAALRLFALTVPSAGPYRPTFAGPAPYRLIEEYLEDNVLQPLPPALRRFLRDTAVLERLSGEVCNDLLGRAGSSHLLDELVERNGLIMWLEDGKGFRHHRLLRRFLESRLRAELGDEGLRDRYRTAGRVLEQHGALTESLQAFRRAESDEDVARLLGRIGHPLPRRHGRSPLRQADGTGRPSRFPARGSVAAPRPSLQLRCLGGFALELTGRPVDVGEIRPRARSLLRLLSASAGRATHVEALLAALWPDLGSAPGKRSLQVAVSSVRRLLRSHGGEAAGEYVRREGDTYRLVPPEDAVIDVVQFTRLVTDGLLGVRSGDAAGATGAFERALNLYRGELLPEEGFADWVLERRRELLVSATTAAQELAGLRLRLGDTRGASTACEKGLSIDRYADRLWRLLLSALQLSGDAAGAARVEQEYRRMLRELGVPSRALTALSP